MKPILLQPGDSDRQKDQPGGQEFFICFGMLRKTKAVARMGRISSKTACREPIKAEELPGPEAPESRRHPYTCSGSNCAFPLCRMAVQCYSLRHQLSKLQGSVIFWVPYFFSALKAWSECLPNVCGRTERNH